jgi:hypothetical protein
LKADHEYLLEGGVFTQDMLDTYIDYKTAEAKMISEYPQPDRVQALHRPLNRTSYTASMKTLSVDAVMFLIEGKNAQE